MPTSLGRSTTLVGGGGGGSGTIGGSGTAGRLAKFTAGTTLGDSIASDDGTDLTVAGRLRFSGTTHGGLMLNNLTTVQRDAIGSPLAGSLIWNTTTGRVNVRTASAWTSGWVRLEGDTMTGALGVGNGTITSDAYALQITSTYNNAGVTFGGALDLNVTNTASAVGSFIARLRVGGTSVFSVTTAGAVVTGNSTNSSSFVVGGDSTVYGASQIRFSTDTFLLRDGSANVIGQRNAANAQTFNIYNTYTSSTNHERLSLRWSSGVAWIDTQRGSGGGSAQPMVLGTDSTERVRLDVNGNVIVNAAAIATNATNGFLYVPSCAGTPTGVPTTYTGRIPIVVDSTNNKLYFYSNSAWRDAGP